MLKTNSKKTDLILERLQVKKNSGGEIVLKMRNFCSVQGQKISIRPHESNHISEYHSHDFFEINYVYNGSCINLIEDENITMNKGDMIIIHPGVFHTLYADNDCRVYNFLIDKAWMHEKLSCMLPNESALFSYLERSPHDDYYKYLLCPNSFGQYGSTSASAERIIKTANTPSPWKHLLEEAAVLEYLSLLSQATSACRLSEGRGASSYKMIHFLIYMTEKYDTVTLDELSKKFFYSKTHICRLFFAKHR